MKKICISKDWVLYDLDSAGFVPVDLPNDYTITKKRTPYAAGGPANGYFPDSFGIYHKYITLPEEKKHYILDIDGAYMCADIRLNDNFLARHPHGYTPFLVDLTKYARFGKTNKLTVEVDPLQSSSRWYSGAGIYRDVFLWEGGDIRIEPWDIFVTTEGVDGDEATVKASYLVASDVDATVTLRASLLGDGESVSASETSLTLRAGEKTAAELILSVDHARLWDVDDPYLYTLQSTVLQGETVEDTAETSVGIRTISFDATHGFRLNGRTVKLRGGCIHHDHGVLGAAAYPAAEERKVRLLKESGFNSLRIAHNPPSLALLEVCDRMGILVMDEAFDTWNIPKRIRDYHLFFMDWWARDISYMVLRDRNHPCVISYSIGNEIHERGGTSDGALWSARLAKEVRKYDATRPVTSGICGCWEQTSKTDPEDYKKDALLGYDDWGFGHVGDSWAERTRDYMAPLDIVGYNYLYERYDEDGKSFPDRVIWGSETHAIHFYDSWQSVLRNDHVIGDYTWTAIDNLGEAGTGRALWARDGEIKGISMAEFPWQNCYQGDLDLCGYRRPQSYFREAVWLGGVSPIFTTHPEHYGEGFTGTEWHWYDVLDTWRFPDAYLGKPVKAELYADAELVKWYLNGKFVGESVPEKAIATIDVAYERGTLVAEVFRDGRCVAKRTLSTVGEPYAVKLTPEKTEICADGRDLLYVAVTVTDGDGNRVPDAKNLLTCTVDGGEFLGIFSGDPKNLDTYGERECHAFQGRAMVVVKTKTAGEITVTVGHNGLRADSVTVKAVR